MSRKDKEGVGRTILLMKENRNLKRLLMECYKVQAIAQKLKFSIFNERLCGRVESAIGKP